jgi:hypothetical protein
MLDNRYSYVRQYMYRQAGQQSMIGRKNRKDIGRRDIRIICWTKAFFWKTGKEAWLCRWGTGRRDKDAG